MFYVFQKQGVFMLKDNLLTIQVLRDAPSYRLFYSPPVDPAFNAPSCYRVFLISPWPGKRTTKRLTWLKSSWFIYASKETSIAYWNGQEISLHSIIQKRSTMDDYRTRVLWENGVPLLHLSTLWKAATWGAKRFYPWQT